MKCKVENNLPVDVYCGFLIVRGDHCFGAFSGLFLSTNLHSHEYITN